MRVTRFWSSVAAGRVHADHDAPASGGGGGGAAAVWSTCPIQDFMYSPATQTIKPPTGRLKVGRTPGRPPIPQRRQRHVGEWHPGCPMGGGGYGGGSAGGATSSRSRRLQHSTILLVPPPSGYPNFVDDYVTQ